MGFGGESRAEEHSKKQKQDLYMPRVKREHGTVQHGWRRGWARTDYSPECVLEQNDELETTSVFFQDPHHMLEKL